MIKVGKISGKYDILIFEEKLIALNVNKTKRSLEIIPWKKSYSQDGWRRQRCGLRMNWKRRRILVRYRWEKICWRFLQMKHQKVIKRKTETKWSKIMDKYAQLKRFHCDYQLQVYMYAFMYVDSETMSVEDHFLAAKKFVENYKKISTLVPVTKHWLGFSYICS